MNLYDAVNHAFTAISTGGYSTKNASIAYWNSSYIEYVITIFMFIGATNMTLVYFCFNGNVKKLIKDEEFRWFFFFCFKRYYRCHGVDLVPWIRLGCRECVP